MAFLGLFGGAGDRANHSANRPRCSIETLRNVQERLQLIIRDADGEPKRDTVDVIYDFTQALIGSEEGVFDTFCEMGIYPDFVRVLGLPHVPKAVKVQLLQTVSMLVVNLGRDTSRYYLFSNNYLNQLISTPFDWSDEDILSEYTSFLKSLAMRLNTETVKLFFNSITQQFPLYIEGIRFFGHRDPMVRTHIQNLTLLVYEVVYRDHEIEDSALMQRFVLERSWDTYFVHLACHLRELWFRLDAARRRSDPGGEQAVQEAMHQQQDLLAYLSDVIGLGKEGLSRGLAERLLRYALFPVVLGSLLLDDTDDGARGGCSAEGAETSSPSQVPREGRLSRRCALYVVHQVFDCFRNARPLLEPFAAALLLPRPPPTLLRLCLDDPPAAPPTYRTTAPGVCGPSSAEVSSVEALDDGPNSPGIAELVARALEEDEDFASPRSSSSAESTQARSVRSCLLAQLQSSDDACVLLASGILAACLSCGQVLPETLKHRCGLLPSHLRGVAEGSPNETAGCSTGEAEVLLLVTETLERSLQMLRVVVVQALVCLALEISRDPAVSGCVRCCAAPTAAAGRALRAAARHVRSKMDGSLADGFLDVFSEEYEQSKGPLMNLNGVREACSSKRCLLPKAIGFTSSADCPSEWAFPASAHSERQHAAKALRCLLLMRRLCEELPRPEEDAHRDRSPTGEPADEYPPLSAVPPLGAAGGQRRGRRRNSRRPHGANGNSSNGSSSECPIHVPEEVADGHTEGKAFDLGWQDRVVCTVATQEGRPSRYFILHPFLLLLVQPDMISPGRCMVRTVAPVRVVEGQFDQADPRVLRLGIRLPKGAPVPSEASPYDPTSSAARGFWLSAEESRTNSLFLLTVVFEDSRRCKCVEGHLRKRRQEVRAQLRKRIEAYVDEYAA